MSQLRILVIDEHAQDRANTERIVRQTYPGARVDVVDDPVTLARVLSDAPAVDLVVTDREIRGVGAVELLRATRAHWPECAGVLLAREPDDVLVAAAFKAGFDDYLRKPPHGPPARFAMVARAALAHRRTHRAQRAREDRYQRLFDNLLVGAYRADAHGALLDVNPAFAAMTAHTRESLAHLNLRDLFLREDDWHAWRERLREHGALVQFEARLRRRDGVTIWAETNACAFRDRNGEIAYYEGTFENITERKWAEQRLNYLARYDMLTGLPNRVLFIERLEAAVAAARPSDGVVPVIFLDLDRFKIINDTLGHEAGDQLLKLVAARLAASAREDITLAHLSGDEFGLTLAHAREARDVELLAQNLLNNFRQPFYLDARELFVSASVGIAVHPHDGTEPDDLVKHAEMAMYRAKARGRNGYQFYSAEMTDTVKRQLSLEHGLRRALERDEFVLHFQPQAEARSGRVVALEALLRWRSPDAGLVPPAEFIPLAEETGLIVAIGEWVIGEACAQAKRWLDAGLPLARVAVNLSARQFQQPGLAHAIERALTATGLPATALELELTESVLMQNTAASVDTLRALHEMGAHIAIDDFGTGYSSLSYLRRFPIDALKIDQSFVRDITTDRDDAAIASAIIALAHSLGIPVVAEGVETEAQVAFLRRHQGDLLQGYYVSRPLPASAVPSAFRARLPASAPHG